MNFFYQSKISNPLSYQDYYEKKRNQQIYKNILDRQVQEKKEREKQERIKYLEENQRNKYFMEEKIYKNEIEERKEREEKKNFYFEVLNEQIREKNQQLYNDNNNIMLQTNEERDYSNINQEGNYNCNFEGNISTVYNKPFFIGRGRNRNERMQNFGSYQFRNDYSNEFVSTKDIEEQLKMQIEEEENMEKNWKFIRNKNNNLVIDLKILFKTNKQLEKLLEDNIENDNQEDIYQEVLYKNNYLQKRFEKEITMIKEIQIIYNYEEEKKAFDNNYNNYFNNGGYNTVENEYYQKRNQFLEKKLNEKFTGALRSRK